MNDLIKYNYFYWYDFLIFNFKPKDSYFYKHKIAPYIKGTEAYEYRIRHHYKTMQFILDNDCSWVFRDYMGLCVKMQFFCEREDYLEDLYKLEDWIHYINHETQDNSLEVYQQFFRYAYRKIYRIKDRLDSYRSLCDDRHKLYFCTITLEDKNFKGVNLSANFVKEKEYDRIRRKLRKHINEFSENYIFNKDFGLEETKRLHFHGVALFTTGQVPSLSRNTKEKFGKVCSFKEIDDHSDYISKYIEKLSVHALKVNYGKFRENLIYSRNNTNLV